MNTYIAQFSQETRLFSLHATLKLCRIGQCPIDEVSLLLDHRLSKARSRQGQINQMKQL